jgi:plastocyanin
MADFAQRLDSGKRAALAVAAILAALLLLAARSGPPPVATAATATVSADARVSISGFKFHPQRLSVARGAKVAFVNSSGTAHTATRGGVFDTRRINPRRAIAVTFSQKGTFAYHCKIHPFMRGSIVVG